MAFLIPTLWGLVAVPLHTGTARIPKEWDVCSAGQGRADPCPSPGAGTTVGAADPPRLGWSSPCSSH